MWSGICQQNWFCMCWSTWISATSTPLVGSVGVGESCPDPLMLLTFFMPSGYRLTTRAPATAFENCLSRPPRHMCEPQATSNGELPRLSINFGMIQTALYHAALKCYSTTIRIGMFSARAATSLTRKLWCPSLTRRFQKESCMLMEWWPGGGRRRLGSNLRLYAFIICVATHNRTS